MSEEPNKYRIKNLEDLATIPADRLDACFVDLKQWVAVIGQMREQHEEIDGLLAAAGVTASVASSGFVWVDDGEVGISGITVEASVAVASAEDSVATPAPEDIRRESEEATQ